jgi:hypothetical protein
LILATVFSIKYFHLLTLGFEWTFQYFPTHDYDDPLFSKRVLSSLETHRGFCRSSAVKDKEVFTAPAITFQAKVTSSTSAAKKNVVCNKKPRALAVPSTNVPEDKIPGALKGRSIRSKKM